MQPLRFAPLLKRIRWGGRRLGTVLGKPIGPENDYAESWEICDHGADQSVVAGGEYAGWMLERLVRERNEELFGCHVGRTQFPLLFKFLDAHDRLSLQVHPNDEQARRYDPRENGKTEAWVILAAEEGSGIFAGLRNDVDRAALERAVAAGDVEPCLHRVAVSAGDCISIPAGTVHAIGEGVLLAEVQQSSDLTFRLFDWGRTDAQGKPRTLHLRESFECIDFSRGPVRPAVLNAGPTRCEELVSCRYFVMRRYTGAAPFPLGGDRRFHILATLEGRVQLDAAEESLELAAGETMLIPATCPQVRLIPDGSATLLEALLP
jgi:mannose-6-phosphate isomerase